uniref:Vacuolar protein sorting-associated protein 72 homolog n=1 Tax=Sinocyclocheilus anshuiensis TaxID=1608454 RepID=A0A671RPH6_9TELE
MSLAFSRAPRKTAGNQPHFYKTTYGGFPDESGDEEYKGDLSETEDEVDSDFDIDEGDEPDSEQEEDGPRRKHIYRRVTGIGGQDKDQQIQPPELQEDINRKSVRQSTTEHTRLTYLRLQERQVAPCRRKGTRHERPLTQAELLAEAKITAQINLRSLENYERLEADKKRQVHMKRQCVGSVIRFHSVLMPLVSDVTLKEENVDSESTLTAPPSVLSTNAAAVNPSLSSGPAKCSCTYITFSEDESFHFFPQSGPVTHKPALYRDPITDIPYANVQAFRIIREAYKKYVAAHGLPSTGTATPADTTAKNLRQKIIIKQGM